MKNNKLLLPLLVVNTLLLIALFFWKNSEPVPVPRPDHPSEPQRNSTLKAEDVALYYNIATDSLQTFEFGGCDDLFYTIVGSFSGEKNTSEDAFELDSIKMKSHILRGYHPFADKKLLIQNIQPAYGANMKEVYFFFKVSQVDINTDVCETVFASPKDDPFLIKKGSKVVFKAYTSDRTLVSSCDEGGFDYFETDNLILSEKDQIDLKAIGGGYECDGVAIF